VLIDLFADSYGGSTAVVEIDGRERVYDAEELETP
jgi:hypothetical protein